MGDEEDESRSDRISGFGARTGGCANQAVGAVGGNSDCVTAEPASGICNSSDAAVERARGRRNSGGDWLASVLQGSLSRVGGGVLNRDDFVGEQKSDGGGRNGENGEEREGALADHY